jgi:hypothetical protein
VPLLYIRGRKLNEEKLRQSRMTVPTSTARLLKGACGLKIASGRVELLRNCVQLRCRQWASSRLYSGGCDVNKCCGAVANWNLYKRERDSKVGFGQAAMLDLASCVGQQVDWKCSAARETRRLGAVPSLETTLVLTGGLNTLSWKPLRSWLIQIKDARCLLFLMKRTQSCILKLLNLCTRK